MKTSHSCYNRIVVMCISDFAGGRANEVIYPRDAADEFSHEHSTNCTVCSAYVSRNDEGETIMRLSFRFLYIYLYSPISASHLYMRCFLCRPASLRKSSKMYSKKRMTKKKWMLRSTRLLKSLLTLSCQLLSMRRARLNNRSKKFRSDIHFDNMFFIVCLLIGQNLLCSKKMMSWKNYRHVCLLLGS